MGSETFKVVQISNNFRGSPKAFAFIQIAFKDNVLTKYMIDICDSLLDKVGFKAHALLFII